MTRETRSRLTGTAQEPDDTNTKSNTTAGPGTPKVVDGVEQTDPRGEEARTQDGNDLASQQEQEGDIEPLGLHVKDALQTINRLQGLGLQRLDIPLPKCIVLGEQSTGKSSVIEAISGIKTPRADDTCTRCPLFITLEPSEDLHATWSARVTIRRDFSFDQKANRSCGRFPGWKVLDQPVTIEFSRTNNSAELEDLIARAQMAVLSPLVDHSDFLKLPVGSLEKYHKCEFSPNVVCITISARDLPSLSFYDLPGIIGQAETSAGQYLVKFVRDLVTDYIKDPESLILLTCSLENDIANSTAGGIARDLKATDRCIGVLTKPDRLPAGARPEKLRDVLDGKRFPLGHGYFVVKNLNQDEINRGLSNKDARTHEQRFFEREKPWTDTFQSYKSRFGTLNLQRFLSGKLAKQITNKLPIIHDGLNARLLDVELRLKEYPEPQKVNAQRIIFDILTGFSLVVRKELEAEYPHTDWRSNWESLQKDFFASLMSLKPVMATSGMRDRGIYVETLKTNASTSREESILIDDSDDDNPSDDNTAEAPFIPKTPSKKRKFEDKLPFRTPRKKVAGPPRTQSQFPDYSDRRQRFQLDDVAEYLFQQSKSRVPGQIEPRVLCDLMLKGFDDWKSPLQAFFSRLQEQMESQMLAVFQQHFSKWRGSALYTEAWKIVKLMLEVNFNQQKDVMAADSFDDETQNPYIFHQEIFNKEKEGILHQYAESRSTVRWNVYKKERELRTGKPLSSVEEARVKKEERIMAIINAEPYTVELGMVAQIRTYFVFATRRFHDAVCMRIESKFFKQLRTQLHDELENALEINDEEKGKQIAEDLLIEHSERKQQRKDLVAMKNSLMQGQKVLSDLQNKNYGDDVAAAAQAGSSVFEMPTRALEDMDLA